jgi:hypothetical protein
MEAMREAWTDERLDDLNGKVDEGFRRVDARFDAMQAHMDNRFEAMNAQMNARFEGLEGRFAALQRTLILANASIVVALIGLFATHL